MPNCKFQYVDEVDVSADAMDITDLVWTKDVHTFGRFIAL